MRALLLAFGLLTWLPVPAVQAEDRDLGRAVGAFPWVGAALGLALAGLGALLEGHGTPLLRAAGVVALLAAVTGGLHLDGLADTFDGLGAGQKCAPEARRARMLEVMRDSRVGAFGVMALIVTLILKVAALGALADPLVWALGCAAARLLPALLMRLFPYARPAGLGRVFHDHAGPGALVVGVVPVLALLAACPPAAALATGAVSLLLIAAFGRLSRTLGGLTGDVYGAAVELGEALIWAGAALLQPAVSTGWTG